MFVSEIGLIQRVYDIHPPWFVHWSVRLALNILGATHYSNFIVIWIFVKRSYQISENRIEIWHFVQSSISSSLGSNVVFLPMTPTAYRRLMIFRISRKEISHEVTYFCWKSLGKDSKSIFNFSQLLIRVSFGD